MRDQERHPNQWLLFLDARTPAAQISALRQVIGGEAELVFATGELTDAAIAHEVQARLPAGTRRLVTTRLDSDDALGTRMLERVHGRALTSAGFLNPDSGIQVFGKTVMLRYDSSSAFMSFVETVEPARAPSTVFCTEHYKARSTAPVRRLPGINYVQVIHDGKLANQLEGIPVPRRWAAGNLGFDPVGPTHPGARTGPAILAAAAARILVRELSGLVRRR